MVLAILEAYTDAARGVAGLELLELDEAAVDHDERPLITMATLLGHGLLAAELLGETQMLSRRRCSGRCHHAAATVARRAVGRAAGPGLSFYRKPRWQNWQHAWRIWKARCWIVLRRPLTTMSHVAAVDHDESRGVARQGPGTELGADQRWLLARMHRSLFSAHQCQGQRGRAHFELQRVQPGVVPGVRHQQTMCSNLMRRPLITMSGR